MKLIFTLLLLAFGVNFIGAQTEFKKGDRVQIGTGSMKNGDFKYIYVPADNNLSIKKINLKPDQANSTVQVLRVTGTGKKTTLIVSINGDSTAAPAKEGFAAFSDQLDKTIATMEKELLTQQEEFSTNEKKYTPQASEMKKKEIDDLKQRISAFKNAVNEERKFKKKEYYSVHWTIEANEAVNSGEIRK